MKKKIAAVLVAVLMVLALALLTGCSATGASDDDCKGAAGTVTGKDYDPSYKTGRAGHKVTHPADYDVTVETADGSTYEKDVSSTAYGWVKDGSRWPSSKHCKDGKVK